MTMTYLFLFLAAVALVCCLFPPKNINYWYGYRTFRSMENTENWKIANKYSAKIMLVSMVILLLISVMFDFIEYTNDILLIVLLLISFAYLFYSTEKKIKKQNQNLQ